MPIKPGAQTTPISYDDFHSLDYKVMGIAFSTQRDLGWFWNEKIYQKELAYRCREVGFENVATEVPIQVSYEDFIKVYYIDLLIDNVIYELKTARTLTGEHEKQAINYLMLTGLNHAKLVNMRPPSVQHRFITPQKRYAFTIEDEQWRKLDEDSIWLERMLKSLVDEWGTFLDVNLYYDAILHFRGGEENVVKEIKVMSGSRLLGRQKIHLINSNIAFKISSVTKDERHYENHLRGFIRYTSLQTIHWINFNHEKVVFKTILK
ncbi:GxxExxY protein [bacterium]|nr:GxxExxY protein [bacterium]